MALTWESASDRVESRSTHVLLGGSGLLGLGLGNGLDRGSGGLTDNQTIFKQV